ncbi:MAG: zinc-binding dehydrogenase [Chloroflexi bacterium]|nr:zinc-binding dehydrogenase [Chloroflexota bacterium]
MSQQPPLPAQMRAVVIHEYCDGFRHLKSEQRPVPHPVGDQVLVRVAAAPINPSDLLFVQGRYAFRKELPVVPGFEGAGTVVAVGEDLDPDAYIGRRVAAFAADGDGSWAEYMLVTASTCIPVNDQTDDEQAAMRLINPLTAWAILDMARQRGQRAVVQSAAAGSLGQMIYRLGQRWGIEVINVVRREEQRQTLQALGAKHIFDSSEPSFLMDLRERCAALEAVMAFDSVAGALTGQLLRALPPGGEVVVQGGLSGDPIEIEVNQLVYLNKRVSGFWLSTWIRDPERVLVAYRDTQGDLRDVFTTKVHKRHSLQHPVGALSEYAVSMSDGKILFVPDQPSN